tara:strand:+ start:833 stop:1054 length:222 start_codon:yes stop_codon:yes gene_type:complete
MPDWKKIILNGGSTELKSLYIAGGDVPDESVSSNLVKGLKISSNQIDFKNLPTTDPGIPGRLYIGSGYIKVSF